MMRLLGVLLMLLMVGCKHGDGARAGAEDVPADLRIMCGQDGTFAGRSMGYSITAPGRVARWEGKYPEEGVESTASVDADALRMLWRRAEEIGFLDMKDQAMARVNWFVSVSADGDSRRVTWVDRDTEAPTPAQLFFDECMATARAALGETQTP